MKKSNIGKPMREARRKLGFTQLDLARKIGCGESVISRIETGRISPESWLKEKVAKELGIPTWEVGI